FRDGPRHFVLLSSRSRSPARPTRAPARPPSWAPRTFRGEDLQFAIRQQRARREPEHLFLVYGEDGLSARDLVSAHPRTHDLPYAVDFANAVRPPSGHEYEQVTWAREVNGFLYVETTHLTYARATKGRNAYVSEIELYSGKFFWRSPAL